MVQVNDETAGDGSWADLETNSFEQNWYLGYYDGSDCTTDLIDEGTILEEVALGSSQSFFADEGSKGFPCFGAIWVHCPYYNGDYTDSGVTYFDVYSNHATTLSLGLAVILLF
mmetsp:Transcript_37331/g.35922  ORF Transcript_37331/g.35922 Transcript_37331/m.35922 type:complete len:113 (-) Transcript_37331:19-357(-)